MTGSPDSPSPHAIEAARLAALLSPCWKSKRGAAVFDTRVHPHFGNNYGIRGTGFNGQPAPFTCSGDCGERCNKLCIHAEQRAIMAAIANDHGPQLDLVHVKIVGRAIVPSGGPSCWQCSRLVVEIGLRGVWLLEADEGPRGEALDRWCFYTANEFHRETLRVCKLGGDS